MLYVTLLECFPPSTYLCMGAENHIVCYVFFFKFCQISFFLVRLVKRNFSHRGTIGSASACQTRSHEFEPALKQYVGSNPRWRRRSRCLAGVLSCYDCEDLKSVLSLVSDHGFQFCCSSKVNFGSFEPFRIRIFVRI